MTLKRPLRMYSIYVLIDLKTGIPKYVGWTRKTIEQRCGDHIRAAKRGGDNHIHRGLRKLRYKIHVMLLESVPNTKSPQQAEILWIAHFRALGFKLWNETNGGDGVVGYRWSKKAKKERSINNPRYWLGKIGPTKGRHQTSEAKEKIRLSKLGDKNPMFGKHHTEKVRINLSKNNAHYWLGKQFTKDQIEKIKAGRWKSKDVLVKEAMNGAV